MPLLKIDLELDAGQLKAEGRQVEGVAGRGSVAFDSLTAKTTAFSFAFNQIADIAGRVAQALEVPFKAFTGLETAMANVASLGVDQIPSLTASVLNLGDEIATPVSDLTAGLYDVVSAGVDSANQINVLALSAKAAKAGVADTSSALNLGSAVIKGYGLGWGEMESVLDKAFQTVKLGQTNFSQLASSAGQVVPLFSALKIGTNELFGSLATLTGVTGNTAEVATQLRGIAQGLALPTKELTQLIREQTGQTVEQAVASKGLTGIMDILRRATGGSAAQMGKYFGSVEAVNAALALAGSQSEAFREKTSAMESSAGAMTDAFEIQSATIESQVQILENRWNRIMVTAVEVGVPFLNQILSIADAMTSTKTEIARLGDELSDLNKEFERVDKIEAMVRRYEELEGKAKRSAEENEELRKIISSLSEMYPAAISGVNQYGESIGIAAGKVLQLVEAERAWLRVHEQDLLNKMAEQLREDIELLGSADEKLKKLQRDAEGPFTRTAGGFGVFGESAEAQAARMQDRLKRFQVEITNAGDRFEDNIRIVDKFFDLGGDRTELARRLELTEEQVDTLLSKWQQLNAEVAAPTAPVAADFGVSPASGIEVPIKPVLKTSDEDVFAQFEGLKPEKLIDPARAQTIFKGMLDANLISEKEFYEGRIQFANDWIDFAIQLYGKDSDEYFRALSDRKRAEEDFAAHKKKQDKELSASAKVVSDITGQFTQNLANAVLQGQNLTDVFKSFALQTALSFLPGGGLFDKIFGASAGGLVANFGHGGLAATSRAALASGNFGQGDTRLGFFNPAEFIVNADATRDNLAVLEAINRGARFLPVSAGTGPVSSTSDRIGSLEAAFDRFSDRTVRAIENVRVELHGTLDGQKFLRRNMKEFDKRESDRRIS